MQHELDEQKITSLLSLYFWTLLQLLCLSYNFLQALLDIIFDPLELAHFQGVQIGCMLSNKITHLQPAHAYDTISETYIKT